MRRMRFAGVPFILFGITWVVIMGVVIFGLWNSLMPTIFSLPAISIWQALGLLLLSRVLFGRFDGWGSRMRKMRFARGWRDLTPEEREKFRAAMEKGGSGCGPRVE